MVPMIDYSVRRLGGGEKRPAILLTCLAALFIGLTVIIALIESRRHGRHSDAADEAECRHNLQAIYAAILSYKKENDGLMPKGLVGLLQSGAIQNPRVLVCPSSMQTPLEADAIVNESSSVDHVSYTLIQDKAFEVALHAKPLVVDATANHWSNGFEGHVLFSDGHVELVPRGRLAEIIAEAKVKN